MVILHEKVVEWIARLLIAITALVAALIVALWVIAGTLVLERKEHVQAMMVAEKILRAADEKLAEREEHVQYLNAELKKWHKGSWKQMSEHN